MVIISLFILLNTFTNRFLPPYINKRKNNEALCVLLIIAFIFLEFYFLALASCYFYLYTWRIVLCSFHHLIFRCKNITSKLVSTICRIFFTSISIFLFCRYFLQNTIFTQLFLLQVQWVPESSFHLISFIIHVPLLKLKYIYPLHKNL